MKPRAIVFDLDGTLVDSRRDIVRACNQMLAHYRRQPLPEDVVAGFVGDGARALIVRALDASGSGGPGDSVDPDQAVEVFLDRYEDDPIGSTGLMPGAREALDALQRFPLALCTNKARRSTVPVLDQLDLMRYFSEIVAGDDLQHNKPHPLPLQHIARALHVEPAALVMVGDGPQDVACGRAVGAYTVGVKGGVLPPERLLAAHPDCLLDTLHGLPPLVRRLAGESDRIGSTSQRS